MLVPRYFEPARFEPKLTLSHVIVYVLKLIVNGSTAELSVNYPGSCPKDIILAKKDLNKDVNTST